MKRKQPPSPTEEKDEKDEKFEGATPPASPQQAAQAAQAASTLDEEDESPVRAPRALFAPPAPRRAQMGASLPPRFAGDPLPLSNIRLPITLASLRRNRAAQEQPLEEELPGAPLPENERFARSAVVRNLFGNQGGPRQFQPGAKRGGMIGKRMYGGEMELPVLKGSPFNRKIKFGPPQDVFA